MQDTTIGIRLSAFNETQIHNAMQMMANANIDITWGVIRQEKNYCYIIGHINDVNKQDSYTPKEEVVRWD